MENCDFLKNAYQLLLAYVYEAYPVDNFFLNIFGCSEELLEFIEGSNIGKDKDIAILAAAANGYRLPFSKIVQLRNEKEIRKILVFSNISLQTIDSLKDFISLDQSYLDTTPYVSAIMTQFFQDVPSKYKTGFKKYLNALCEEIHPDVCILTNYLKKTSEDAQTWGFNPFIFNRALYVFQIWSSSSDLFFSASFLKKIVQNSVPATIQKKLSTPKKIDMIKSISKLKQAGNPFPSLEVQKKNLRRLFYNREYESAFETISYEQLTSILKYTPAKKSKAAPDTESELVYPFQDIYDLYLNRWAGISCIIEEEDLANTEKSILEAEIYDDHAVLDQVELEIFCKKLDSHRTRDTVTVDFTVAIKRLKRFCEVFKPERLEVRQKNLLGKCQSMNLEVASREKLCKILNDYFTEKNVFVNKLAETPGLLLCMGELLTKSIPLQKSFYSLVQTLYGMQYADITYLASGQFFEELILMDAVCFEDSLLVPVYSPALLFYLQILKNRYKHYLKRIGSLNSSMAQVLQGISPDIPNQELVFEEEFFRIQDAEGFPCYMRYEPMYRVESIQTIDIGILQRSLAKQVEAFPYKCCINLCIWGDVDPVALKKCVSALFRTSSQTNLNRIRITLTPKSQEKLQDFFSQLLEYDQQQEKKVELKIELIDQNNLKSIDRLLNENDILVFLDSHILFKAPVYIPNPVGGSDVKSIIANRRYEREQIFSTIDMESGSFPIVPHIVNAFVSSSKNGGLKMGKYDCQLLNEGFLDQINRLLDQPENSDKTVYAAFSKPDVDAQIRNNDHILDVFETMLPGKTSRGKVFVFGTNVKSNDGAVPISFGQTICLPKKQVEEAFGYSEKQEEDSFTDEVSLKDNEMLIFDYSDFLQKRTLAITYEKKALMEEDAPFIVFLNTVFADDSILFQYYRMVLVTLIRKNATCMEDLLVAKLISNEDTCRFCNGSATGQEKKNPLPALPRNFCERLLELLDAQAYAQSLYNDFISFYHTSGLNGSLIQELEQAICQRYPGCFKILENNLIQILKEGIA